MTEKISEESDKFLNQTQIRLKQLSKIKPVEDKSSDCC